MGPSEALAAIRLNPATLDKFLISACSLADNLSPPERDKVLLAAKEARSMGLLIDHLRSLFSHQVSIELQGQTKGSCIKEEHENETILSSLSNNELHLHQLQQQNQNPHQNQHQHQDQDLIQLFTQQQQYIQFQREKQQQQRQQNYLHDSNNLVANDGFSSMFWFAHANMQTIFKAARGLASNVARLLYLTDTIDERETSKLELMQAYARIQQQQAQFATCSMWPRPEARSSHKLDIEDTQVSSVINIYILMLCVCLFFGGSLQFEV